MKRMLHTKAKVIGLIEIEALDIKYAVLEVPEVVSCPAVSGIGYGGYWRQETVFWQVITGADTNLFHEPENTERRGCH